MVTKQDVYDITAEVYRIVDSAQSTGWADDETKSALGSIKDYMNQLDAIVEALEEGDEPGPRPGPSPEPEPEPEPTHILGYYGTYNGHGLAQDVYPGHNAEEAAWGRHDGVEILAPKPGRIEHYQFGTPLNMPMMADAEYAGNYRALFEGWTCIAPPGPPGLDVGGQTMHVAVYIPDGGITLDDGSHAAGLGFAHVRSDVATGRVDTGGRMATVWNSGINFEASGITARAAHLHLTIFRSGSLSPNGDVDGKLALRALGWECQQLPSIPGPSDYMSGRYCAGRLMSDFASGGHPVPPQPS